MSQREPLEHRHIRQFGHRSLAPRSGHHDKAPDQGDTVVIYTTDIHLPRRIGEGLHRAYEGKLAFNYVEESYLIRASWKRDK